MDHDVKTELLNEGLSTIIISVLELAGFTSVALLQVSTFFFFFYLPTLWFRFKISDTE